MSAEWFRVEQENTVTSPSVLLYPERIQENIRRMIAIAGSVERLRPHVKTHKLPQVIQMQVAAGITKFKCSTLSEAVMVAQNGGKDIIVAFPLYGPMVGQLLQIKGHFPHVTFSTIVDNLAQSQQLEAIAGKQEMTLDVFLDLDVGMERTGIKPGEDAHALYRYLNFSSILNVRGLHIYDGQLHIPDLEERTAASEICFDGVNQMIVNLRKAGMAPGEIAAGGSPTFPVHAQHSERTLCPGTVLLWDWRYHSKFRDLDFQHAAVLFTRVVSKPGEGKLCLDLGHKAVGSEMEPPRVHLLGIDDYRLEVHSEEHMVISLENAGQFKVGDVIYGIPIHICPTMALHDFAWIVEQGQVVDQWKIQARTRALSLS